MKTAPARCARHEPAGRARAAFLLIAAAWCAPAAAQASKGDVFSRAYFGERPVILYPGDRCTVFDNDGSIEVHLIVPPLRAALPGERVELLLDDRVVPHAGGAFALREVGPGMHRLQARIVTAGGVTIVESRPVRFYQWHAPPAAQAAAEDGPGG